LAFSWIAPANDGGTPVTGYDIWWDQGSSNWIKIVASQTATFFTKTGLIARNYSFQVAAINSIGTSIFSNKIIFETLNNLP
jgi:titin